MTTQIILVVLIALGFIVLQRRRMARTGHLAPTAYGIATDVPVPVRLEPLGTEGTDFHWSLLTYSDGAGESRLRVGYEPQAPQPGQMFVFTRGLLQPVPGSAAEPLLRALADAHGSTITPVVPPAADALRIDVAILGTKLSVGAAPGNVIAGEFTSARAGEWTVLKLFIHGDADDSETGELFLALNDVERSAQFMVKDPAYWPALAPMLARLLAGTPG